MTKQTWEKEYFKTLKQWFEARQYITSSPGNVALIMWELDLVIELKMILNAAHALYSCNNLVVLKTPHRSSEPVRDCLPEGADGNQSLPTMKIPLSLL